MPQQKFVKILIPFYEAHIKTNRPDWEVCLLSIVPCALRILQQ
jgi:hypothetical protein